VRILGGLVVTLLALAAIGVGACSGSGRQDEVEAERRGSPSRSGELALVYREDNDEAMLVRLDPESLRLMDGRRLDLGRIHGFPTFSPDGKLVAFTDVYSYGRVQVVDVERLRTVARLDIGEESVRDPIGPLAWLDDQLLAVVEDGRPGDLVVTRVDPFRGSVDEAGRVRGPAWVLQSANSARHLVLLLGRPTRGAFRPTELAVADSEGRVRTVTLTRVPSGLVEDGPVSRSADPALAVDEDGERAFVVGAGALVAELDLETMEVRYHELARPVSLLGRLLDWLEPQAYAKGPTEGVTRKAVWLGNDLLAVTGSDTHVSVGAGQEVEERIIPAGLSLIDTKRWSVRLLDERVGELTLADSALLAWTFPEEFVPRRLREIGLTVYELDGRERIRLFEGEGIWDLQAAGRLAYVGVGHWSALHVVDLETGKVVRRLDREVWPQLLTRRAD
jgi:hypothetical protein